MSEKVRRIVNIEEEDDNNWKFEKTVEEEFTHEELKELEKLHEEAIFPSQEEEDWMLMEQIKEELTTLEKYRVKDVCPVCYRMFFKKGSFQKHMQEIHNKSEFKKIKQESNTKSWLSKSLPNIDLFDEFGCRICGKKSKTKNIHNDHLIKSHSKGAIEIATECVLTHLENIHILCKLCGESVKDDNGFKNHIEKNHFILGGGDTNLSSVTESSEEREEDNTDDENLASTKIYTEHEWGK